MVQRSLVDIDRLLSTQNGTFDGAVLFATSDGSDTFIYYVTDADTFDNGTDIVLIAVLKQISSAQQIQLSNFVIDYR